MKPRLLIVDDDAERSQLMRTVLSDGYDCGLAHDVSRALSVIPERSWSAAIVDYDLAFGGSGLEVLQAMRESSPRTFRIMYTNYYSQSLMRDIARLADPHRVIDAREVGFLLSVRRTLDELFAPPPPARSPEHGDPLTVRSPWTALSPASVEFLAQLRAAAESDAPVFLHGEPGSGHTRAAVMLREWRNEWKARGGVVRRGGQSPVATLRVPPLRERPQDLPTLALRCIAEYARDSGEAPRELAPDAIEELLKREWFGNVVELRAVILRACQRAGTRRVLHAADLPNDQQPPIRPSQQAKEEGQLDCMLRELRAARTVTGAAKLEGCTRANYIRMMRRLGILRADITGEAEGSSGKGAKGA
jgi:DNA-binding NtrC family response regulator